MKSRNLKHIIKSLLVLVIIAGCSDDERGLDYLDNIGAPANLGLAVSITQDNSGTVTLTPSGDNASTFVLDFGDGTQSEVLIVGESVTHIYDEGTYEVTITGTNLIGDTAQATQTVTVLFAPPANLQIFVNPVAGDNFTVNVSASADFATSFLVYFGDVTNEDPTPIQVGETIMHTYPAVGSYELRVVALNGGSQTIEGTTTVMIVDPILLPIDFESPTINYNFINFGGASVQVIANPDPTGANTSANVAEFFKEPGAEIFAGTVLVLNDPIDFSNTQALAIKSWAPTAGLTVKLKLENADDNTISEEIDVTTTVANEWETLTFDFSGADLTQEYSKVIVFYDFGNTGNGDTFYFDDIEQVEPPGVELPVDFENPNLNYGIFGFEGADSALEANPDPTGINTSATVLRTIKTNGAQFFAGTIVQLDQPIDFSTTSSIAIKTYSPKMGIPIRLKLENADASAFVELDATNTVVNEWEEVVWDFTGMDLSPEFVKVIVFFEFVVDLPGDGSTYYYDDIRLGN
jgi:hypothetical protein